MIIDHISLPCSDLARSQAFFDRALAPLGIGVVKAYPGAIGMGRDEPEFWVVQGPAAPTPSHVAFVADNRAQVDAFHTAALLAGASDNGAPGLRTHYHANYYAAFVIGPDGHNIEAVCQLARD
jgi:catechol 2,3-dioxygenase-like lactoylglutathione lyase family enzyme